MREAVKAFRFSAFTFIVKSMSRYTNVLYVHFDLDQDDADSDAEVLPADAADFLRIRPQYQLLHMSNTQSKSRMQITTSIYSFIHDTHVF